MGGPKSGPLRRLEGFEHAGEVSKLLAEGGLPRRAVTPDEMRAIEPTLQGSYFGGWYTESDSTGDIHKFTHGLGLACERLGVRMLTGQVVDRVRSDGRTARVTLGDGQVLEADAVVVCAGVHSRALGAQLGESLDRHVLAHNLCLLCGKPPTDIRMDYLSRSVYSLVSSTGSVNPNPCPCQTTKRHFQFTLNRSHIRSLELIALKSGTVILN